MAPFSTQEEARMLSGVDFLQPLSKEELEGLAQRCPDHHYGPGEIISLPRDTGQFPALGLLGNPVADSRSVSKTQRHEKRAGV